MKNVFKIILVASAVSIFLIGCKDKNDVTTNIETPNIQQPVIEPPKIEEPEPLFMEYTSNYNFDELLDEIQNETNLSRSNNMNTQEAISLYELGEYQNINILIRKDGDREIAMIQIPDSDKTFDITNKISSRIEKLNVDTSDESKFVMEINDGIVTVVVCDNARKISDIITETLKVK